MGGGEYTGLMGEMAASRSLGHHNSIQVYQNNIYSDSILAKRSVRQSQHKTQN